MISSAYAQTDATSATAPQTNPAMSLIPFVLVFAVFYFLMIRPQKKRMEQEKTFLGALKKGDEIYTKSGIIGTIVGLTEKVVDLEITRGVKVKVLKSQIADKAEKIFATASTTTTRAAALTPVAKKLKK